MICCLDLEGVLVPEIWINVAKMTKIKDLELTTRDEPDYDVLMKRRLFILRANKIKLADVQKVIKKMKPLRGAAGFLRKLKAKYGVIILSDTYYEFAGPLMKQLDYPTLFCNSLSVDNKGYISDYHIRKRNGKEKAVRSLKILGFNVCAIGDSYNDLTMLKTADKGILFKPPANIARENDQFKVARTYDRLLSLINQ